MAAGPSIYWLLFGLALCLLAAGLPFAVFYSDLIHLRLVVKRNDGEYSRRPLDITFAICWTVIALLLMIPLTSLGFNQHKIENLRFMTNAQLRAKTYEEVSDIQDLLLDERHRTDEAIQREERSFQSLLHIPPRLPTPQETEEMNKIRDQENYEMEYALRRTLEDYQIQHRANCMLLREELLRRLNLPPNQSMDSKYNAASLPEVRF